MTSPIEISDLDPAVTIDPANDLVIVRQGITDKKVTVAQINQVSFASLAISGTPLTATDVLMFGQNDGLGGYQNYAINPQQIGFLTGVRAWFYQATAPLGWQIVPGTGDRVLGVSVPAGSLYNGAAPGTLTGTWQQGDVSGVPGNGLTVDQIPNHQHWGQFGSFHNSATSKYIYGATQQASTGNPRYGVNVVLGIVGGAGDTPSHDSFGACNPHNHGSSWRIASCVGIVCEKIS